MASNQFPMKLEAASAVDEQQQDAQQQDAQQQDAQDVAEEMRCQYSSKRCENRRTHKKSGGLHKFCAMHREKANRNQMRLDHRRRVTKLQQKELQRQQQQQAFQQAQMQRRHASAAASAAGQSFHSHNRARVQQREFAMHTPVAAARAMPAQTFPTFGLDQQQTMNADVPPGNLFNEQDLQILEALLFSSDEEAPSEATKMHVEPHPHLMRSASYVNV